MRAALFDDRDFLSTMLRLAGPIAAQQLIMSALGAIDILMVGQLGETAVAGVTLANQVFFLLSIIQFGISSGAGVFAAQFWGRNDLVNLRHMLGIALLLNVCTSLVFSLVAIFAPEAVLGIFTTDPAVVAVGSSYLRITGFGFLAAGITWAYAYLLRSISQVRLPVAASVTALSLKTLLGYLLIFGHLGLPALGTDGAALSTAIARWVECGLLLALVYAWRLPVAASPAVLAGFLKEGWLIRRFVRTSSPVILGEVGWALASTTYQFIYARVGTAAIASVSIAATVENIALMAGISLTAASATMVGNRIGAGDEAIAAGYAHRFLAWAAVVGVAVGMAVVAVSGIVVSLYQVSPQTAREAQLVMALMAIGIFFKTGNFPMLAGIMRGGGDTRFAFAVDVGGAWLVGIPLAALAAFGLGLPVPLVYAGVLGEEAAKYFVCLWRIRSKRWIHNVVRPAQPQ